jgi:outer membrane protein OmpA-like peptidoglycan-associated protein
MSLRPMAAMLLIAASACAPVRPAPGALAPVRERASNEIMAADLATIDAWEVRRVALLRNNGADVSTRADILARAGAWLVFAHDVYVAQPRTQTADYAVDEARRLMESLRDPAIAAWAPSASGAPLTSAPAAHGVLIASAETLSPELRARLRALEGMSDTSKGVFLAGGVRATADEELRRKARTVHFGLASDELKAPSASLLDGVAGAMREHPELSLVIEGHADPRGADMSNLDLSGRRADAVRDLLIGNGVDGNRVLVRMLGATQRNASGNTLLDYARNRRVQLKFVLSDGSELPVTDEMVDLQIEQQRLWLGALRPRLRRFVAAPGSTVVERPRPLTPAKSKRKVKK